MKPTTVYIRKAFGKPHGMGPLSTEGEGQKSDFPPRASHGVAIRAQDILLSLLGGSDTTLERRQECGAACMTRSLVSFSLEMGLQAGRPTRARNLLIVRG